MTPAGTGIRRATADDAPAVADVWLAAFGATYEFPAAHSDEDVRDWVRETLLPSTETWVADEDGSVVGIMSLTPGWVEQLYVLPEASGGGIGSRFIEHAKDRQPDGLQLWTFAVNAGARRFYERHGFVVAELTDGAGNEERQPDVRYTWR